MSGGLFWESLKYKKGTRLGLYVAHRDTGMAGFLEGLM